MQQTLSTQSLVKLSLVAFIFAVIVLITLILPAEYNIDPTGIGQKLGLTQLAPENNIVDSAIQATNVKVNEDSITVLVPAGRGIEYKFSMRQYDKLTYKWQSDAPLYHDLHGEPEGDTTGYFESYVITTTSDCVL